MSGLLQTRQAMALRCPHAPNTPGTRSNGLRVNEYYVWMNMKNVTEKFLVATLLVALLFGTAGCLGPAPRFQGQPTVVPPPAGSDQPYRVEAVLSNAGPGEGQVEVEINLINRHTGEYLAKHTEEVQLHTGDTVHITAEIPLPPSARNLAPEDIEVKVDAHYPIH